MDATYLKIHEKDLISQRVRRVTLIGYSSTPKTSDVDSTDASMNQQSATSSSNPRKATLPLHAHEASAYDSAHPSLLLTWDLEFPQNGHRHQYHNQVLYHVDNRSGKHSAHDVAAFSIWNIVIPSCSEWAAYCEDTEKTGDLCPRVST